MRLSAASSVNRQPTEMERKTQKDGEGEKERGAQGKKKTDTERDKQQAAVEVGRKV